MSVEAFSNDERFSGQTFRANFILELEKAVNNSPPRFDQFNSTTQTFTFTKSSGSFADNTVVGGTTWSNLRDSAMQDNYTEQDWYEVLLSS